MAWVTYTTYAFCRQKILHIRKLHKKIAYESYHMGILKSPQFWCCVITVGVLIWIYHASPKQIEGFSKVVNPKEIGRGKTRRKKRGKRVNKSEEECRRVFEKIFKAPFPTTRKVPWLKNPDTGMPLELDGYNPDITTPLGKGLAFEYDGSQHSAPSGYFHGVGAKEEFSKQFARDQHKTRLCKKHKVLLIRIPHFIDFDKIEKYIKRKLRKEFYDRKRAS